MSSRLFNRSNCILLAQPNRGPAYRIGEDRVSVSLHCEILTWLTSEKGQNPLLPHRNGKAAGREPDRRGVRPANAGPAISSPRSRSGRAASCRCSCGHVPTCPFLG